MSKFRFYIAQMQANIYSPNITLTVPVSAREKVNSGSDFFPGGVSF